MGHFTKKQIIIAGILSLIISALSISHGFLFRGINERRFGPQVFSYHPKHFISTFLFWSVLLSRLQIDGLKEGRAISYVYLHLRWTPCGSSIC